MKFNHIVSAVAVAVAALAAPAANAAFINGGISFTGFFQSQAALTNLPTSMVSLLTTFDVRNGPLQTGAGSTSGAFVGESGVAQASDFTRLSVPQQMFVADGYSFKILAWGPTVSGPMNCSLANGSRQCIDTITLAGVGEVSGNGYQPTGFTMSWSAQGSCNESSSTPNQCAALSGTASYSASISATGQETRIPEPASLALVGLALVGLGFTARRRAAK